MKDVRLIQDRAALHARKLQAATQNSMGIFQKDQTGIAFE